MADDEDDDAESVPSEPDVGVDLSKAGRRVTQMETCLAWGGEQRMRLRMTISAMPGGPHCSNITCRLRPKRVANIVAAASTLQLYYCCDLLALEALADPNCIGQWLRQSLWL